MNVGIIYRKKPDMVLEVSEKDIARIQEAMPNDNVSFFRTYQELYDKGFKADILVGGHPGWNSNEGEITFDEYCDWAKTVRWNHVLFTGVEDVVDSPMLKKYNIILTNSGGVMAMPIADHIMTFILCYVRCIPEALSYQSKRIWKRPPTVDETCDKTLGVIGMGKIGTVLAARAKAFNMNVIGYKRTFEEIPNVDKLYTDSEGLDKLLSESDFVVLLLPYTKDTDKFIDSEKLAKMKRTAYFINNGRGDCVDDDALIHALRNGIIAGAALDAQSSEPFDPDSPLWGMENVIITAHYGGDSRRTFERGFTLFLENLPLFLSGKQLINTIDLDKKY